MNEVVIEIRRQEKARKQGAKNERSSAAGCEAGRQKPRGQSERSSHGRPRGEQRAWR